MKSVAHKKNWSDRASLDYLLKFNKMKNWKTKLWKLKIEKQKVEKLNAEFGLKFMFTFQKPILATSNSRFVSWLVQFLSEFLSLNQYFVYFWIVKCRNYATRQSGKTLLASNFQKEIRIQFDQIVSEFLSTSTLFFPSFFSEIYAQFLSVFLFLADKN